MHAPGKIAVETYFNFASVALIASKFGKSFGVGVCSLYCTTPFLSITNAARAAVSPTPGEHREHHVIFLDDFLVQIAGEGELDVVLFRPRFLRERAVHADAR